MADTDEKHGLTRIQSAKLRQAQTVANLLDRAVRVPGTKIRFGLDAVLGLIPGGGDVAGAVFSSWLILLGSRLGLPRHVLMQMVANVAIDTVVGSVPLIGDLFDVAWKSNTRNYDLLARWTYAPADTPHPVAKGWVAAALVFIALLLIGGIWLAVIVIRGLINLAT